MRVEVPVRKSLERVLEEIATYYGISFNAALLRALKEGANAMIEEVETPEIDRVLSSQSFWNEAEVCD